MQPQDLRQQVSRLLTGKKLFLKIFLWFWLTVIGMMSAIFIPRFQSVRVIKQPDMFATVAPILAAQATQAYETGGAAAFQRFASSYVDNRERKLYLLDGYYHDVLSREISDDGLRLAHSAKTGQLLLLHSRIAAFRYVSPLGRPYIFLLYTAKVTALFGNATVEDVLYRVFIILVITLMCFWLARHITAPILKLQEAARLISQGKLSARAPSALFRRHDELRDLSIDFNTMVERIEALVGTHKRLLASVSHEVRSPLTRLTVATAFLRRPNRPEDVVFLNRIDHEVVVMDVLMGQLLTLARLEGAVQEERLRPVDLSQLLEEVAADANFESAPLNKEVVLRLEAQVTLPRADSVALRSALENVIRNATRYAPENTAVLVQLVQKGEGQLRQAVITVRDAGPGVPEKDLDSIFQPFFRVVTSHESDSGNGLGLTIAAEAVHLHNGKIVARNQATGGLEVEFSIPVASGGLPRDRDRAGFVA